MNKLLNNLLGMYKQAKLNKKAEEDLIAISWGLYTYENNIKANAEDDGRATDREFWNKINNDIDKVESWFLKEGYKQFFTKVRDEDHGKDSELGGTAFVTEEQLKNFVDRAEGMNGSFTLTETSGALEFPIDYDETIFFELVIFVDEKILDDLNIESKRVSKNKKLSSKNTKLTKKAGWKVLTPKDLAEEVNNDFLKQSLKDYLYIGSNGDDLFFIKGIKEKEGDQFSYDWEEGMTFNWRSNANGEKWYTVSDFDNWDYVYLIKEDKLYKMPNRESLTDFGVVSSKRVKLTKKAMKKSAGYSNNSDYFGDWFGEGQIDFSKIINPNDEGKVWMVKLWGGSGYILDVYLVKANDFYDATNKVFEWSYENEGINKNVFDREHLEKEALEYFKDEPDMFGKKLEEEDFIDRFLEEYYVGNEDYSLFARDENFFAEEVPEEYLKGNKQSSKTKLVRKQAENKEIVVTYEGTNGKEYIVKAPNGLYFNEYVDTDTQHSRGAGPFETLEKAKEMFKKHRPSAKEVIVTKKKAVLQESENGLGYVLPNGSVVYPGDEAYLKSEYKANKQMLEKDKKELERLEGIIKKYPDINFDKNKDSVKFQIPRLKKGIEYLELFNETIEDILNAFKNKKMGKQATKKQAGIPKQYQNNAIVKRIEEMLTKMDMNIKSIEGRGLDYKKVNTDGMLPGASSFSGKSFNEILKKITDYYETSRYNKKATKKTATIKHENGVYNVYSESGKCLGKGYKTKEEAEKRLKQVEYFKNKKAATGYDFYGPKEMPNEDEGTFRIMYYGGPGHIDYLRKSRNGKYHWVEQTHFDYINDKPFETTDYELAKKLVEQYGGEIEKKESKQVNNKRTSLKQVVISKMAKTKK